MELISLLILLIIVCLLVWVGRKVITALGLPSPVPEILYALIAIVALLYLAGVFGVPVPSLGLGR